ncbi:MAG: Ku protein [Ilumatobacteraceae bacterium]
MARPVWSGTISFGLVAIPVKLYSAVRKQSVSFNQLDERSMARIKYRKVSAESGEEVPDEHIVKGYEVSKGRYVVVDPDELEPFIPTATHSIDLEQFVDLDQIDPVYFDAPYIVAPDKNPKPYALLTRAMAASNKVAIGRFVMRNKQYVAALRAVDGTMMMSTMVFADEVVPTASIDDLDGVDDIEVSDREVAMAESLVESLSAAFDPSQFHDTYREQVLGLIDKKAAGEEFEAPVVVATAPAVIDLMAALEASVQAAKEARGRHPAGGPDSTLVVPAAPKKAAAAPAKKAAPKKAATKSAPTTSAATKSARPVAKAAAKPTGKAADKPAAKKAAPRQMKKSA